MCAAWLDISVRRFRVFCISKNIDLERIVSYFWGIHRTAYMANEQVYVTERIQGLQSLGSFRFVPDFLSHYLSKPLRKHCRCHPKLDHTQDETAYLALL